MSLWFRRPAWRRAGWIIVIQCSVALATMIEVASVSAETRLIPLISITETYDSNVWYAPKEALAPGLKLDDFVTLANPQLLLSHTGRSFNGSLTLAGVFAKYVNNSQLDYAGFNASAMMDFLQLGKRMSPRVKALNVYGSYQFTPSASAFGGGGVGFAGVGFGTTGTVGTLGPFDSGLVTNRVRITSYTGTANTAYALTPRTDLQMSYSYSQISFGGQFGVSSPDAQNQLFNTTSHLGQIGINTRLSPRDSLTTNYSYSIFQQPPLDDFDLHTANLTWSRTWTRQLTSSVGGGAQLIPGFTDVSSGRPITTKAAIAPTATALITWSSFSSTLRDIGPYGASFGSGLFGGLPPVPWNVGQGGSFRPGQYAISLSYNYAVFPSFVAQAGPMHSHVAGAQAQVGVMDRMTLQVGLNFARSVGTQQATTFAFDTYGTTASLNYLITPSFRAALTHTWLEFADKSPVVISEQGLFAFSKHMVMVSLSYAFTPARGFFRSGAFQDVGTGSSGGSQRDGSQSSPGGSSGGEK